MTPSEVLASIPVIPMPALVTIGAPGVLRLSTGSRISIQAASLTDIVAQFIEDVAADTALWFEVEGGGAEGAIAVQIDATSASPGGATIGTSPQGPRRTPEDYRLEVSETGVRVQARSDQGVFRGLTTLLQLICASMDDTGVATLDAVVVRDAPRYAWRGLSVDVVRTFFSPEQLHRVIDIMALFKMNVLHLHLTDDQGWRIEIPGWPKLTDVGAAGAAGDRPGGHYTRRQFCDLIDYAAERFITVIPEIDMPGHCGAAIRSYPSLAVSPGGSLLDPDHPGVLDFAAGVIAAIADLTPGPFIHLGGDEAFGMPPDSYRRFVDSVRSMAIACGMQPIFWQEAARSTIGSSDIVQHWLVLDPPLEAMFLEGDLTSAPDDLGIPIEILSAVAEMFRVSQEDVAKASARGAQVLLSPASHLYLDRPYAESSTDPAQVSLQRRLGLKVYPRHSVEEAFAWDPVPRGDDTPVAVAGIEAAIWCETIASIEELEFMLLPRLPGIAERAWSPSPGARWEQYRIRLGAQAPLWASRGWTYFTSSLVDWAQSHETSPSPPPST